MSETNARAVALSVIRDVFTTEGEHPRSAHEAFDYRSRKATLSPRDRAFATELAYGTIKMRRFLDRELEPFVGDRVKTLPPAIAEILRLGAYQLRVTSGVETHAAVFEQVSLAKKYGHKGTAGLVNAVLRRLSEAEPRCLEASEFPSEDDRLGTKYSYPTWIVSRYRAVFGDLVEEMLRGMNAAPPTCLRVNLAKLTREQAIEALQEREVEAHASPFASDSIVIAGGAPSSVVVDREHRWETQAEIACVPVDILDPKEGESIIDACSGRGNKTTQIASRMLDRGDIQAVEIDDRKVQGERERIASLGLRSVTVLNIDAAAIGEGPPVDGILIDAPCSGLGILGRQPEARWRKSPDDYEELVAIQAGILEAAARRVKPGGRIVYAVCTTDPREGAEQIATFLAAHAEFARTAPPERYAGQRTSDGDLLFAPGLDGHDGFFISRLERALA